MKVIHSCTSKSFSGLEKYVVELASWQKEQGYDVEIFCRRNTELQAQAKKQDIPTWTIEVDTKISPWLWQKMNFIWQKKSSQQPIALHMHAGGEPWFHLPWLMFKPKNLKKIILHYHIWINHFKKDPLHYFLFSRINEFWTSSDALQVHLAELLPVNKQKIYVIPYGRNLKELQSLSKEACRQKKRKEYGIPENALVGICVSRIEPLKGIEELLDAFVCVAEKFPLAVLWIVGDVSPADENAQIYFEKILKKHVSLNSDIKERIHFLGYRSDFLELIAAADFYVLPSYEECMSLALLDAFLLDLPLIGTNSGGTPSIIGKNGILFQPRSVDALTQALKVFCQNSKKYIGVSSPQKEFFDKEKVFKKIWDWYNR